MNGLVPRKGAKGRPNSGVPISGCLPVPAPPVPCFAHKTPGARPPSAGPIGFRLPAVWVAALAIWTVSAAAQDTVHVSRDRSSGGHVQWTGRVLDYTGIELRLKLSSGQEQRFPAGQVVRIETQYTPRQVEADARFARREFRSALDLYAEARATEPREWVRRQITARMVWCYCALGQLEPACREFLVLILSDPTTPYLACIPLAWAPSQASPTLERSAREWLAREELPAAVLLGASHLMSSRLRLEALDRLKRLCAGSGSDEPVALLALAQTWRAAVATADQKQLLAWRDTIERMPEPLRAGPYYVLGQGWAQRQAWDRAALAWLRVPILYPEHRLLAAQALLDAARAMERLDRSEQAAGLYGELVNDYPETPSAAEARARLQERGGAD
jgi:tetratricopeptide (TPR) repeat protein